MVNRVEIALQIDDPFSQQVCAIMDREHPLDELEFETALQTLKHSPFGTFRDRWLWVGMALSRADDRARDLALTRIEDETYRRRFDVVCYIGRQYSELIAGLVEQYQDDADGELVFALARENFGREPHQSMETMLELYEARRLSREAWDSVPFYVQEYHKMFRRYPERYLDGGHKGPSSFP